MFWIMEGFWPRQAIDWGGAVGGSCGVERSS